METTDSHFFARETGHICQVDMGMMFVCTLHWYFRPEHVRHVISCMKMLGPPILRGFYDAPTNTFLLREGTHRIRAAHHLGIVPTLKQIPWWRSRQSLINARYAAAERALTFSAVNLVNHPYINNNNQIFS